MTQHDTRRPRNILFLMTDQHRVDTLGCHNPAEVSTPRLDALAASGTRFERAYTPTAICTPARASLLTGRLPFRHKLLANYERNVGYIEDLPSGEFTFSAALADAGYRLGLYGKWHVGTHRKAADFGFEGPDLPGWHNPVDHPDYLKYLEENGLPPYAISGHVRGTLPNGNPGNLLAARLHQPVEATFEHYLATGTIEALHRHADEYRTGRRPFFLATHFFGPHLPYLLPEEYYDLYDPEAITLPPSVAETFEGKPPVQRNYSALWTYDTLAEDVSRKLIAVYRGYVALIDFEIGRILDTLRDLGLDDSTAVFFTADHGEFTGAHRLHDKGPAMYEDIYRIPGIVRVPGLPSGQVRREFVGLTDCTATILDLAGLDPAQAVDGSSLLPLLAGEDVPWRAELTAEFHGHHFPYPQRMIRDDRYKLIVNPESRNELYDLETDPHELHNRHDHPDLADVRRRLTARLYTLLRERGDNFHHWMSAMSDTGPLDHDPSLAAFETGSDVYTAP
ncbi:sulfatase-like hydrolase/transferase [Actinocorallia sp. API 0066]|uniref:sulfatase-like hydrolase/transferase n=1 Tax=Actinocorallia sp. API 0066 TaxID=2896846 RepID=UPI001E5A2E0C|nr:sulfatase-like hydrolase/transferase [Actinocorallia sp. API 0066]MCD0448951.1 sulfatase-like hydrolase/transferase [Actinocorallia sp. API 0066]